MTETKHPNEKGEFKCRDCNEWKAKDAFIQRDGAVYGILHLCRKCKSLRGKEAHQKVVKGRKPKSAPVKPTSDKVKDIANSDWRQDHDDGHR